MNRIFHILTASLLLVSLWACKSINGRSDSALDTGAGYRCDARYKKALNFTDYENNPVDAAFWKKGYSIVLLPYFDIGRIAPAFQRKNLSYNTQSARAEAERVTDEVSTIMQDNMADFVTRLMTRYELNKATKGGKTSVVNWDYISSKWASAAKTKKVFYFPEIQLVFLVDGVSAMGELLSLPDRIARISKPLAYKLFKKAVAKRTCPERQKIIRETISKEHGYGEKTCEVVNDYVPEENYRFKVSNFSNEPSKYAFDHFQSVSRAGGKDSMALVAPNGSIIKTWIIEDWRKQDVTAMAALLYKLASEPYDKAGDDDGDGLKNGQDFCSQTPAKTNINRDNEYAGCAAGEYVDCLSTDYDMDDIPDRADTDTKADPKVEPKPTPTPTAVKQATTNSGTKPSSPTSGGRECICENMNAYNSSTGRNEFYACVLRANQNYAQPGKPCTPEVCTTLLGRSSDYCGSFKQQ